MATKLQQRVKKLRDRKTDPYKGVVRILNQRLAKSEERFDSAQEAKDYLSETMEPVDVEYTNKTFEESDRVKDQIAEACHTKTMDVSFKNQGSVTNNTHIKIFSDIDLLVITERFVTLKSPLIPTNPYKGDPIEDLSYLRSIIESRLKSSFYEAKVDTSGKKAVRISGGSLKREIDVIPSNWYDTQDYRTHGENYRGVQILDLNGPTRITNFPFLHNKEISDKDADTKGALRKLIRFIKSARYDADNKIDVSSYDIASLCYHVSTRDLINCHADDILIGYLFLILSQKLVDDSSLRAGLYVPNKTRLLFGNGGIDINQLKLLNDEVSAILEQARSVKRAL